MSLSRELEPLIGSFEHLTDQPRAAQALESLRKIASLVKPIMRQRSWKVGILEEMYPAQENLLGLNTNKGQKISLRLRYPGDHTQFLPTEQVVDTMLHELAHIVHGPHDQHFHALWDKLRDEHESLLRKGYTGEGFLGKGNRVGGRDKIPPSEARRLARQAAEKRKALTAGSGQKLGGGRIMRGEDARAIIAAAAERRITIERGCALSNPNSGRIARAEQNAAKTTRTQAEREDENEAAVMQAYIDLIQEEERKLFGADYVPPSESNPAGTRGSVEPLGLKTSMVPPMFPKSLVKRQAEIEQNLKTNREERKAVKKNLSESDPKRKVPSQSSKPAESNPESSIPESILSAYPETWACDICTLVNPINFLACDACSTERPEIYSIISDPTSPPPRTSSRSTQPHSASTNLGSRSSSTNQDRLKHPALQPRLKAADSHARIAAQEREAKQKQRVGWMCGGCGNWMEQMWWTCSVCGRMKESS